MYVATCYCLAVFHCSSGVQLIALRYSITSSLRGPLRRAGLFPTAAYVVSAGPRHSRGIGDHAARISTRRNAASTVSRSVHCRRTGLHLASTPPPVVSRSSGRHQFAPRRRRRRLAVIDRGNIIRRRYNLARSRGRTPGRLLTAELSGKR